MKAEDNERQGRLRPGRPRLPKSEVQYTHAFRSVLSAAKRVVDAATPRKKKLGWASNFQQRCVVKLSFSQNKTGAYGNSGQWAAHGSYIARPNATHEKRGIPTGFDATADSLDPKQILAEWQAAGDPRLFKMVISPELGHRIDLKVLTRQLMTTMQTDLRAELHSSKLEWVATIHKNTHQPHVHLALRGLAAGHEFRIPQGYVKHGFRRNAQDYCTRQLGFRTKEDAALGRALREAEALVPKDPRAVGRRTPEKERS